MNIKKGITYVFIANALNLLIGLFSGFILPKFLSIETYSSIKLYQMYITYIGILHLGYSDGMYLYYGGKNINNVPKKEMADEFKTFKIFQLFVTLVCVVVSLIMKNNILLFCSLSILPINIGNYLRNQYSAIGEFKHYSRFTNINTFLIFIINLLLLFIVKTDNSTIYIVGYIVMYFVYWMMLEIEHRKLFGRQKAIYNQKYINRDIKSGFFLMVGSFCNVIFTSIDRLFVKYLLGTIKFAFYSFAVSIENLMNVFVNPISTTLYNYFCINNKENDVLKVKRILLIFSAFIIALVFPAKFVVEIFLNKYEGAINVLILLFAAQYISIIVRCVHVNLYKAEKKQNKYFVIMICVVILSIVLNTLFYKIRGTIEFIAIATLITNIIWFIIGELEFKKYKLSFIEYFYFFFIIIVFLACCKLNSIIGLLIYIVSVLVLTSLILNDTLKICYREFKRFIKRFRIKSNIENSN